MASLLDNLNYIMYACYRLRFHESTGHYSSISKDVKVKVPGFGGTDTVEQLSQSDVMDIPGFDDFVDYFEDRGYKKGKDIRGAPYDWRRAPGLFKLYNVSASHRPPWIMHEQYVLE